MKSSILELLLRIIHSGVKKIMQSMFLNLHMVITWGWHPIQGGSLPHAHGPWDRLRGPWAWGRDPEWLQKIIEYGYYINGCFMKYAVLWSSYNNVLA